MAQGRVPSPTHETSSVEEAKIKQRTSSKKELGEINEEAILGTPVKMLFFSFAVTCTIMQKNGAGLHTASTCFWDNATDGSCTVRWENKTMYCIVSVFGLAI